MVCNARITIILLICLISVQLLYQQVNAEPIFITKSIHMEDIKFDGKWTDSEWKPSSLTKLIEYNTVIRSAHQGEFIYILVDVIGDKTFADKEDKSIICFDTKNNKSLKPDNDDYCFIATLNSQVATTLQGDPLNEDNDYFKQIPNPVELIAIGGISDNDDKYSKIPHTSYEFKIPTDFIGRSDNYGFLVYVYDANSGVQITYPDMIDGEDNKIPSPSQWGDLISPDKSLPEFGIPTLLLISSILPIILLTRLKFSLFK